MEANDLGTQNVALCVQTLDSWLLIFLIQ